VVRAECAAADAQYRRARCSGALLSPVARRIDTVPRLIPILYSRMCHLGGLRCFPASASLRCALCPGRHGAERGSWRQGSHPYPIQKARKGLLRRGQYRRRQADVICRCATLLLGRVTLGVSRHLGARESESCWPADSGQATQGDSKPESRNAFWSNVKVQEQPALVPSAAMTASANEPCPSLSAIMALKTSCSFSTTSTSV